MKTTQEQMDFIDSLPEPLRTRCTSMIDKVQQRQDAKASLCQQKIANRQSVSQIAPEPVALRALRASMAASTETASKQPGKPSSPRKNAHQRAVSLAAPRRNPTRK